MKGQPGSKNVQGLEWIETVATSEDVLVTLLQLEVDEEEVEAIALALELEAELLLLDERREREVASRLELNFTGILGVLIEAKHKGLIVPIKPILDDLMTKAGFWISQKLYDHVLQIAKEK